MWTTADPFVIDLLNRMSEIHNISVVISSTWRLMGPGLSPTGMDAINSLRSWGYTGDIHDDWQTPYLSGMQREHEILSWLQDHRAEVETYASLDDLQLPKWTNNVLVHPNNGLTTVDQMHQLHSFLSGGGRSIDAIDTIR